MADDDSIKPPKCKTCTLCNAEKPLGQFSIHRQKKDGLSGWCKPCSVEKVRSYTANPEAKQKKRDYDADRVARLRDKLTRQRRALYVKNRERRIAYAKLWAAENAEKRRVVSQNYKHRRRAVEASGVKFKDLMEWKAAQKKVCAWCGVHCGTGYVVDHYQPLAKGGAHELSNLVISCRSCNAKKSARDPYEFANSVGRLF